ncbi:restriction endonuclease subunit S [Bacteroides sp. ET225]|uniref:restriction endonuclease subunit S n=1 Tax=Bacteroides sp. ET225 TaxID=2972461 RepID=UPI0021ACFBE1|nr:restriction endonuclease subunit S [Bacteroides sp. ET225]MCR8919301.1 restriction endonuclease subunit S [Bacteroides sp. ET225]
MADCIVPEGYKKTLLGVIPKEWKVKRLEFLCSNKGDYGINAPAVTYSKDLPTYLRITDIDDDGRFITVNKTSVNSSNSENFHLQEGDIVFARTGATVGKTYLYNPNDGDLVFAGFLIRFSPDIQKIIPSFLRAYTNTSIYWNWVKIISQRSGQPGINAAEYCSLQIPVPPLKEQQKIVKILSVWDKAIEKQTQLIEKLELRKKGLIQQLLTGKKRLPGGSGEWKKIAIKDFAIDISLKNTHNENWEVLSCTKYDGLVPSLQYFGRQVFSKDITQYKIVPQYCFAYATNHIEEGSIGYQSTYRNALISPMYTVFKTDSNVIDDIFLYKLLKSHRAIYLYNVMMEGSIDRRGGLRWDNFSTIKFLLPDIKEQSAIADILVSCDNEILLAKQKLNKFRQQKKGLMQVLLTGKKRVNI